MDTANGPRRILNGTMSDIPGFGKKETLHVPGSPNLCSIGTRVCEDVCDFHWMHPKDGLGSRC